MASERTEKALKHLRTLKPYDGWSIDSYTNSAGKELVVLKRRNASLSNSGFESLLYDEVGTKCILGITGHIGSTGNSLFVKGVALVEKDGLVARDQREIRATIRKEKLSYPGKAEKEVPTSASNNSNNGRRASQQNRQNFTATTRNSPSDLNSLSDEQNGEIVRLALIFIGFITLLRMVAAMFSSIYVIVAPLALLYAMQTCPSNETFEAKKELKRVLRGAHLPEGHPGKAKEDWLSNTVARVTASVTAEVATALGHEVSYMVRLSLFFYTFSIIVLPTFE